MPLVHRLFKIIITKQSGLAFLLGSVAVSSSARAENPSMEESLSDEAKQQIAQALMKALEDTGELGPGGEGRVPSKDVLNASSDVLPNRTPFEMQYELFKRGMELEDEDNYLGAEKQWTEIIENFNSPNFRATSPGNKFLLARAYSNRGNTRLSLQKTREAILDYSESIDLVPEKGEFWLARGVAYEVRFIWRLFFSVFNAGGSGTPPTDRGWLAASTVKVASAYFQLTRKSFSLFPLTRIIMHW